MKQIKNIKQKQGWGLINVALALVISSIVVMSAFNLFIKGKNEAHAQKQVHFLHKMDSNAHGVYNVNDINKISAINSGTLITKHLVPNRDFRHHTIGSFIGNHVTHAQGTIYNGHAYILYSTSTVSNKICVYFSKMASNYFNIVAISHGADPNNLLNTDIMQDTQSHNKLNISQTAKHCTSGLTNTITVANSFGALKNRPMHLHPKKNGTANGQSMMSSSIPKKSSSKSKSPKQSKPMFSSSLN